MKDSHKAIIENTVAHAIEHYQFSPEDAYEFKYMLSRTAIRVYPFVTDEQFKEEMEKFYRVFDIYRKAGFSDVWRLCKFSILFENALLISVVATQEQVNRIMNDYQQFEKLFFGLTDLET